MESCTPGTFAVGYNSICDVDVRDTGGCRRHRRHRRRPRLRRRLRRRTVVVVFAAAVAVVCNAAPELQTVRDTEFGLLEKLDEMKVPNPVCRYIAEVYLGYAGYRPFAGA